MINSFSQQLFHAAAQKVFGIYQCCLEFGCYGTHSAERCKKILCQDRTCPISLLLEALNRDFFCPLALWQLALVFFGTSLSDVLKTGHEMHASFSSTLQSAQPHSLHARLVHLLWTSDEIEPTCKSSTHQWKHKSFYFAIEVGGKMISVTNNSTSRTCWPEPNISWRAGKYSPCQHLLANFNQVITTQGLPRL